MSRQKLLDVEPVVNKFYAEYKNGRAHLVAEITNCKDPEAEARAILDRLIFLYFLQAYQILPERQLQDAYERLPPPANYFQDVLCPLWFETMTTEPGRRAPDVAIKFPNIPYLNVGQFAKRPGIEIDGLAAVYKGIVIPNNTWKEIFAFLNLYQWRINEEERTARSITPEIIGYIYEKSLTEQHETGAYYTPRQVTEYISQGVIVPALTTHVNEACKTKYNSIMELVAKSTYSEAEQAQVLTLYRKLKEISICDNACGCGAFLLAAENVLADLYAKCIDILNAHDVIRVEGVEGEEQEERKEWDAIRKGGTMNGWIKRQIITHNLYGVDVNADAVEIAKMRLWLSVVAEMDATRGEQNEPLPNLDHNIRRGNGLIGYATLPVKGGKIEPRGERLRDQLDEQFCAQYQTGDNRSTKKRLVDLQRLHWGLEFPEIFAREKGGFDIILGNPPYIKSRARGKELVEEPDGETNGQDEIKKLLLTIYRPMTKNVPITRAADTAMFFVLRSYQLLAPGGYHSYIITNKWLLAAYGKAIRHFLRDNTCLLRLQDLNGVKIFKGANVDTCIYVLRKQQAQNKEMKYNHPRSVNELATGETTWATWDQGDLRDEGWRFQENPVLRHILAHVKAQGKTIKERGYPRGKGLETGCNPAFVINSEKRRELLAANPDHEKIIKPFVDGENVTRYAVQWEEKWVLFLPWHFPLHKKAEVKADVRDAETVFKRDYPQIYAHLAKYKTILESRGPSERGRYEWYCLKRFSATYYPAFETPKIMWQELTSNGNYCWDVNGIYPSNSAYVLAGCSKALLIPLNSKLCDFYFAQEIAKTIGKGGKRYTVKFVEQIPIADIPSEKDQETLEILANLLAITRDPWLDSLANHVTYEMYFRAQFVHDHLYPANTCYLLEAASKHLTPVDYDGWSKLDWKRRIGTIIGAEQARLDALTTQNAETANNTISALQDNPDVKKWMGIIASHPWVMLVETTYTLRR